MWNQSRSQAPGITVRNRSSAKTLSCNLWLFRAIVLCLSIVLFGCSSSPIAPVVSVNNFVYTANEAGTVSALETDAVTGALATIAGSPYAAGSGSTAVAADPSGKFLYIANYLSSNISAFTINSSSGALTQIANSPFAAELGVDSLVVDSAGKFLYAVTERSENLWAYSIDGAGALSPLSGIPMAIAPSGTQSKAVLLDPSGKYLFVTNGDSSSAYIYGFSRNVTSGALTSLAGFPVSVDGLGNETAFNPAGQFLLVTGTSVFGTAGGVTVFSLSPSTGAITKVGSAVQAGIDPNAVVVDSSGKFVFIPNTGDATISAFTLDATGGLTAVPGSPFPSGGLGSVNGPLGISTDAVGQFVYVCNASNDISVFSINTSSGALTPIKGSPFPDGGNAPSAIIFVQKP